MEFRELLQRRRLVRNYTPEPVDRAALERIVGTIRRVPSAGYTQGFRLVVVTDPEIRAEIAQLADEHAVVAEGREPWYSSAPVHVFVCTREDDYHERYREPDKLEDGREIEWPVPYWHFDAGAAAMMLLLAAADEGLATGVYGVPPELAGAFRNLVALPADVTIDLAVTIGHAAPDPGWSAAVSRRTRPRKPLEELVRWNRWSS
jgi:nitroreductase